MPLAGIRVVPRIFRMLDLNAHGADGQEVSGVGFVLSLPPLRCFRDLSNMFRVLSSMPGNSKLVLSWRRGRGLEVPSFWMLEGLYNYLPLPTCAERDKMLLRSILRGGVWNGFLLGRARDEEVKS